MRYYCSTWDLILMIGRIILVTVIGTSVRVPHNLPQVSVTDLKIGCRENFIYLLPINDLKRLVWQSSDRTRFNSWGPALFHCGTGSHRHGERSNETKQAHIIWCDIGIYLIIDVLGDIPGLIGGVSSFRSGWKHKIKDEKWKWRYLWPGATFTKMV